MDISSLQAGVSSASALGNLVIVKPQNASGYQPLPSATSNEVLPLQPALAFHYEGENTATCQSDITDHFIEDNTPIQDQITLKPVIITVHGYIGDLNNVPPNPALLALNQVANKLIAISSYTPSLSISAQIAYNDALEAYQTATAAAQSAVSVYQSISGGGGLAIVDGNGISNTTTPGTSAAFTSNQSPQQIMFQQFYGYWVNRVLFNVQTPWAIFQNMAIQTLRSVQDETTQNVTDFEVTFKMIRYASTATSFPIGQGRRNNQIPDPTFSNASTSTIETPFPGINT